jgi:hypothetical protein
VPWTILRRLALLLVVVAPVGCTPRGFPFLETGTPFDSGNSNAIVVIGMAGFSASEGPDAYDFALAWRGVTPDEKHQPVVFYTLRHQIKILGDDIRTMKRSAYLVQPGLYHLSDIISYRILNQELITRLKAGPTIRLEAGQITYIGDFTVDAKNFPAKMMRFGHDDDAARVAMQDFPEAKGELHYVPPTVIPATH